MKRSCSYAWQQPSKGGQAWQQNPARENGRHRVTATALAFDPRLTAEMVATVLGILSVWLLARGNGRGWPLGVLWAVVVGASYWMEGIRGQAALSVYFLVAQLIGWKRWASGQEEDMRRVARLMKTSERCLTALAWVIASGALTVLLDTSNSRFPALDAFATVGSLIGQALIVAGFAECWLVYLLADVALVALSVQASLWGYVLMNGVYCGLAWQGWREWTRDGREEKRIDAPLS